MDVASRYTLLALLTLFTQLTWFKLVTQSTLLTQTSTTYTLSTLSYYDCSAYQELGNIAHEVTVIY